MFPKVTMIIIMRFGGNNVLCPKYIDIYEFMGVQGGCTMYMVHHTFFVYYSKKWKKYKIMTDT